ncbi:transposase [Lactococcus piscium]|uniref:Transposase n=1 Tax=Pseudolactococcus piscium TaxID=1364 RepID=A0A2A5RT79_9LACT|nr:transposase [Lactococcus piscium]
MIGKLTQNARNQMQFLTLDELIPEDHMLRQIDETVDFTFIYKLVVDKYTLDNGRPSLDPVMLIKLPLLQYLCGIKSMRQTIKDVEVNAAYRWFLGLSLLDEVPHFTTFGKNYKRRFAGTDLFEQIFNGILS